MTEECIYRSTKNLTSSQNTDIRIFIHIIQGMTNPFFISQYFIGKLHTESKNKFMKNLETTIAKIYNCKKGCSFLLEIDLRTEG